MTKLTALLLFFYLAILPASAQTDVEAFFQKFVSSLNSYDTKVISHFVNDATIIRNVIKSDGTTQSVNLPFNRYSQELLRGLTPARVAGYKNNFSNIQVVKKDENRYKITAIRTPNRDKTGLACHYIVVRQKDGSFKIQTESWDTNHQGFLKYGM